VEKKRGRLTLDRLIHRAFESSPRDFFRLFVTGEEIQGFESVDSKLTAVLTGFVDKLYFVRFSSGVEGFLHFEVYLRPNESISSQMLLYAGLIKSLSLQKEYKGARWESLAIVLEKGPEEYLAERVSDKTLSGEEISWFFRVLKLWELEAGEFLGRYPAPLAPFSLFRRGPYREKAIESYKRVEALKEELSPSRWNDLYFLWRFCAERCARGEKDMEDLADILEEKDLELLGTYNVGKKRGRREGLREGKTVGLREGVQKGEAQVLLRQLQRKFGSVGPEVRSRLSAATSEQLLLWADRILTAERLEDIFQT